jgi:hypothetical protein
VHETAEEMAKRLTRIAAELKANGRHADTAAALAGTLAIYLDQRRATRADDPRYRPEILTRVIPAADSLPGAAAEGD